MEDAGDVGAGFVELAGVAGDVGEVHADRTAAGCASESGRPQLGGAIVVSGARFDDAEICGGVDHRGVGAERMFVEFARFGDVAAALREKGQGVEQNRIVRMIDDRLIEVAFGLDGGRSVAFLRDGFPCESEIARVAGGCGCCRCLRRGLQGGCGGIAGASARRR